MSNTHGTDHMANERTFLAWIRTSIAIMAFGFVVEKFSLFSKQMAVFAENINMEKIVTPSPAYSALIGLSLVILGVFTSLLAFVKFRITNRQIENQSYRPFYLFELILTLAVLLSGILLAIYLKKN